MSTTTSRETQSIVDTLKAARDLISDPARFDPNGTARDADGNYLYCGDEPAAVAWCSLGAIWKFKPKYRDSIAAIDALREAISGRDIVVFSSTHSHVEVLAAFDRAIAKASQP